MELHVRALQLTLLRLDLRHLSYCLPKCSILIPYLSAVTGTCQSRHASQHLQQVTSKAVLAGLVGFEDRVTRTTRTSTH